MTSKIFVPATLALALLLSIPALGQAAQQAAAPQAATPAAAKVDPDKAYLLKQEFVAKTAELHGKIKAREAELETLLGTKPGDEAAIKKLAAEISTLRGQLFEQKTLYRLRYAKETGTPIRETHHMMHGEMMEGGMMGGMSGGGMDCKMMGKGMGKGMMMGMDHGAMSGMDHGKMSGMDHGNMQGMDHGNMPGMDHGTMQGMDHSNMPGMTAPTPPAAKEAPAKQ